MRWSAQLSGFLRGRGGCQNRAQPGAAGPFSPFFRRWEEPTKPNKAFRAGVKEASLEMLWKIGAVLLLCGSTVAQKVREDEARRLNLFVTAVSSCSPSGANRWHVACVLELVPSAELCTTRMHASDLQVGDYLVVELSHLTPARHLQSRSGARISSQELEAVSGGVFKGLRELQRIVARIGVQQRRNNTQISSRRSWTPSRTSRASSRALLAQGTQTCGGYRRSDVG